MKMKTILSLFLLTLAPTFRVARFAFREKQRPGSPERSRTYSLAMSGAWTVVLFLLTAGVSAQVTNSSSASANSPSANAGTTKANPLDVHGTLQRIEQTAQAAALDLARLRVEKWKADGSIKDQAQANADSLSRNMTTALPTLIAGVRTGPQNMVANFKLYRNLNALYDVFEGLAESAGAFGSKQEYEVLSQHVQAVDTYRRAFGDYVEALAASKDADAARSRAATAPTARPKKIIVDNEPAPKSPRKKR